jgi:hypothetical protein
MASCELYDPATNTWGSAASLATARYHPTATVLPNGKLLVAAGMTWLTSATASAELYDPTTESWSSAGSLAVARGVHTATLLANSKVLVAGGYDGTSTLASAELYATAPPVVRIAETLASYASLQSAYAAAISGQTIQAQAGSYAENLVFGNPISVALKGGYDASYTTNAGSTLVNGSIDIRSGSVQSDNISVQ